MYICIERERYVYSNNNNNSYNNHMFTSCVTSRAQPRLCPPGDLGGQGRNTSM